jgi:hypothetical protein
MSINEAIIRGDYQYVRDFLEAGNDPNVPYKFYSERKLPLFVAIKERNFRIVKLLLDRGADPYFGNKQEFSALHVAAAMGDTNIVRELLRRGMNANTKDADGTAPINVANSLHVTELLLEHGADPNNKKWNGDTPLHQAVSDQSKWIVRALINADADVSIRNSNGETPLQLAEDIVQSVKEAIEEDPELEAEFANMEIIIDLLQTAEHRQKLRQQRSSVRSPVRSSVRSPVGSSIRFPARPSVRPSVRSPMRSMYSRPRELEFRPPVSHRLHPSILHGSSDYFPYRSLSKILDDRVGTGPEIPDLD